jgi:hypothetical protein
MMRWHGADAGKLEQLFPLVQVPGKIPFEVRRIVVLHVLLSFAPPPVAGAHVSILSRSCPLQTLQKPAFAISRRMRYAPAAI